MGIGFSKSTLGAFKDCKRHFWLEKNKKIEKPRGLMPSILNGLDDKMKQAVEAAQAAGVPVPWLKEIPGAVPFEDMARLKKFRHWSSFKATAVVAGREITLWGELDHIIRFPHLDSVAPWDYKSNGKERATDYFEKYYQIDADVYDFILTHNGFKCTGDAYFTSLWPIVGPELDVRFDWKTYRIDANPEDAVKMASDALQCLEGSIPPINPGCEHCKHSLDVANCLEQMKKAEAAK